MADCVASLKLTYDSYHMKIHIRNCRNIHHWLVVSSSLPDSLSKLGRRYWAVVLRSEQRNHPLHSSVQSDSEQTWSRSRLGEHCRPQTQNKQQETSEKYIKELKDFHDITQRIYWLALKFFIEKFFWGIGIWCLEAMIAFEVCFWRFESCMYVHWIKIPLQYNINLPVLRCTLKALCLLQNSGRWISFLWKYL